MRTKNKRLDSQHQELAVLSVDVAIALRSGDPVTLAMRVQRFEDLLRKHFDDEIEYLREERYPAIEAHEEVHRVLLEEVRAMRRAPSLYVHLFQAVVKHVHEDDAVWIEAIG